MNVSPTPSPGLGRIKVGGLASQDTTNFLIKENERDEDLLLEATKIHIAIAKS